jgi:hypothetical protein
MQALWRIIKVIRFHPDFHDLESRRSPDKSGCKHKQHLALQLFSALKKSTTDTGSVMYRK